MITSIQTENITENITECVTLYYVIYFVVFNVQIITALTPVSLMLANDCFIKKQE